MQVKVVVLECASCQGPVSLGITLGFSIHSLRSSSSGMFSGSTKRFSIPLVEGVWMKDPQNSLSAWPAASQCDLIQVLSRLSKVRILGDWTTLQESVALDDVRIANTKGTQKLFWSIYDSVVIQQDAFRCARRQDRTQACALADFLKLVF
jgi:hypothetical protein